MKILNHMKKALFALAAMAYVCTACSEMPMNVPETQTGGPVSKIVGDTEGDFEAGSLLVMFDDKTASRLADSDEAVIRGLAEATGMESIAPALLLQPKNMEVARKYGLHRWFVISFDKAVPTDLMVSRLAELPSVDAVQYNSFVEPVESVKVAEFIPTPVTKAEGETYGFGDPYLKHQWNLVNTGDRTVAKNAVEGADVGVRDAWRLTGGDPEVVVAIFDCAVNSLHEDLSDALWVNEGEISGNGKDDDGNGFIDDVNGFNFVGCTKTDGVYKGKLLDWTKGSGHGTHVAGIIGAVNGNGKGVSSIAGGTGSNDGVRLMSCQIFQGKSNASDSQVAAAFIYAADNGACIAQCSYGNMNPLTDDDVYIDGSPLENAALKYFLDPANSNHSSLEGNIAVFAAGNHGEPYSSYPGALPYVISVTAFGADHLPGGYTNYGPGSKIAAPGGEYTDENNYGTMILSTGVSNAAQSSPGLEGNRNYVYMQGTSMACPHVSGVIALGISYAQKLGKTFTREEFTSLLLTSVNDMDRYCTGTKAYYDLETSSWTDISLGTYKGRLGTGSVDAWKFLMAIEGTPTILVGAGKKMSMDISRYVNGAGSYTVTVDDDTRAALGLSSDPVVRNGRLEIECSKVGSGKIVLSGNVGKDTEKEDGIGEMAYSRTISVASRPFAANNGGWL